MCAIRKFITGKRFVKKEQKTNFLFTIKPTSLQSHFLQAFNISLSTHFLSLSTFSITNHSCIFTSSNNSIISYSEISKSSCVSSLYANKVLLIFLLIYLEFLPLLSQDNHFSLGPLHLFGWMMNASISSLCPTDPSQYG